MHHYILALGSNRHRGRHGGPRRLLAAATDALAGAGCVIEAQSAVIASRPVGPSRRTFANAVLAVATSLCPHDLLRATQAIERDFGRRRARRWGARVIDIDIIWWSGGIVATPRLAIPHPAFRQRDFVLVPLQRIAPALRDPLTGRSVGQLAHRLRSRRPRA